MIQSVKYGFVYFHIPKTGGSSIAVALGRILGMPDPARIFMGWQRRYHSTPIHMTMSEYGPKPGWLKAATFVRDPWSRFVSIWRYFGKSKSIEQFALDWPEDVVKLDVRFPQMHYVIPEELDFVGRFEAIESEFERMCNVFGMKPKGEFPHYNENPDGSVERWQDAYRGRPGAIELVGRIFATDAEAFGYQPPEP